MNKSKINQWLVILILAAAFLTRFYRLSHPLAYIYDEVYHAFTAQALAQNDPRGYEWWHQSPVKDTAYEWLHPPLAKLLMAGGVLLFGNQSFGWRFFSALFGILVVYLTYLTGKKILIVDDISETGGSLDLTVNLVKEKGVKNLKIATLHCNPSSKLKPDYYVEETDKWIIYPWDAGEHIRLIMKKGMSWEEKKKELIRTGIPTEIIKTFVDKFE